MNQYGQDKRNFLRNKSHISLTTMYEATTLKPAENKNLIIHTP